MTESTDRSRLRRLVDGWSANLVQTLLAFTQQLLLIPAFLHFWTSDTLAAWLAIYAAGTLFVVADAGLQLRAVNRFLAFKSTVDCDGRTANYYASMLQIYFGIVMVFGVLVVLGALLWPPSALLGFRATASFDSALLVVTGGMLLAVPANLVTGLYRVRGKYGRAVWLQNVALLLGQVAQLIAITSFRTLLAVAIAFVSMRVLFAVFLILFEAPRMFPFLRHGRAGWRVFRSWRWNIGQVGLAFPFAIGNITELALINVPVLLVSALVVDRVAVAQWGLTRVVASLVRGLCLQATMPLAAELGHDYAIGDRERLRRLYAYGSVFITVIASLMVAGLLPFWADFFTLWTHGRIPCDSALAVTLLLGSAAAAPSLLALVFAYHSNRGGLVSRAKGLQLAVFLALCFVLVRWLGPLGAALAVVISDLSVQFGLLKLVIMVQTLRHPVQHMAFVALTAIAIVLSGWTIGAVVASLVSGSGLVHFVAECATWLVMVCLLSSPLLNKGVRARLVAVIPA